MAEEFRFSPRPNRAHEIEWRAWSADAFENAASLDKPVLLNLTTVWCHECQLMDETTYSDPSIISLLNERFLAVRVDADRYPHVQDRYIAGGWPTNAFLTPTGEVLWSGTYVEPEEFRRVALGVAGAWSDRREELRLEIDRRRKAMQAARSRQPSTGIVRREAADDVVSAMRDGFDARNGGFGDAPKFPPFEAIELMYAQARRYGETVWLAMAERTLDGMLAGELRDPVEGGFYRYALAADWTLPQREKLLEINAGMLAAYALAAQAGGRADWREAAEGTVDWAERALAREDGLWSASQAATSEYFELDAKARKKAPRPYVDAWLYTNVNAHWIRALADAGGRLGRRDWIDRAEAGLDRLLESMSAPDGLLYHCRPPAGEPAIEGLLLDAIETAQACVAVAQAAGRPDLLERAGALSAAMEQQLWAVDGGFFDYPKSLGAVAALRWRDRPFEPNAAAARLFVDLTLATGERSYRAGAERLLATLSPLAGRFGVAGAVFALAVDEFFDPPPQVVVVGEPGQAEPLRAAALRVAPPDRRVWSLPAGGRIGGHTFDAAGPAAYVCSGGGRSSPLREPADIESALRSTH